jgi:plastocyanin
MSRSRLLCLAILAATLAACGGSSYGSPNPSCSGSGTSVSVCDNFYSPATVTITAGSTVTWTWRGAVAHSVTFSGSGPNSAVQSNGHVFTNTFNTPGTFTYQCLIHGAAMSGTIQVN